MEREWQCAQQRLILYLRLLDMPALEALSVAMEALRSAEEMAGHGEGIPGVTLAMRSLRGILEKKRAEAGWTQGRQDPFRSCSPWSPPPDRGGIPEKARSMPLHNRGSMVPEKRGRGTA